MSSRPRPRSASLKALPPDQPAQAVEVQSISAGAVHWSVNSKEKPGFGQRQRPLKSVSLKLAKGDGSPTASTRSNSAGAAWGSGELLVDGRQCIRQAGSGPSSRGSANEAAAPPEKGRSRQGPAMPRGELASDIPVGRPPVPKAVSEVSANHQPSSSSYPTRSNAPVVDDEETASRPSSASYQRAAAIYASLPKTPGGSRTLVRDADGFIFRPTVEAEVKAAPKPRLRPGSRGLNELVASLTKRKPAREAPTPVADVPPSEESLPQPVEPPALRIAWSEGSSDDAAENFLDASDLAAQIRRDWLAKQLSELEEGQSASTGSKQDTAGMPLRTEDGRKSMGELEKSLAKAKERAEKNRKELKSYMESLRNKVFQVDEDDLLATKEELLVSLPADFDDVVDINASLTARERRHSKPRNSLSSRGGGPHAAQGGGASELAEGFRLPSFLEKYFYDEKAVELPIVHMQRQESELDKVARQVAKLDVLLSRREAEGLARLKAAKEQLDATKEHLQRESEQSEAEKIELLRVLKEKGLLKSQSSNTSKAPSAASSSVNSPRHSASVACVPPSPSSEVDWSGWECSLEQSESVPPASAAAPATMPATSVSQPGGDETAKEEESDTSTFNLTATTADLSKFGHRGSSKQRSKLEPVAEDAEHDGKSKEQEAAISHELAVPSPLPEELLKDPYDLQDIQAIDDKLAQIVPESEWEAKSIRSAANGSEASGIESKTSKHTVLSRLASSSLPGEPVLREQLEEREARKALVAIDDQLGRLQEQRHSDLQPEQLQQLLLQAAASQSAMDSSSKVLSLTAEADDLEAALQRLLRPLRVAAEPVEPSGPFMEAKQILSRLSESNEEWHSTNIEARCTMAELEESVRALEETASRPNTAQKDDETDELIVEMSTWTSKLEELGKEAIMLAEQGLPQVQHTADPDTGGADASAEVEQTMDMPDLEDVEDMAALQLPSLTAAEQEGEDLLESDAESGSSGNSPVFLPVSQVEVAKAVDLDLPEGRWSDEDLERLSRAMDEHFGPVKRRQLDASAGPEEGVAD